MNLYVDSPIGNNTNSGTQANPWKTIQYAVDIANAGDTIYVMGGTYPERVILHKSGADGNPITIKNYNGQTVTMDGTGITWWSNIYSALFQINGQSNWIVEGINLVKSYAQGFGDDYTDPTAIRSYNVTIRNCTVTDAGGCGVYFNWGDKILLDGVVATRTNKNLTDEGISLCHTDRFEIKNCRIIDCYKEGIDVKQGSTNGSIHDCFVDNSVRVGIYLDAFDGYQHDIELYNNTVVNNTAGIGLSIGVEYGGRLENILFRNNLVYNCLRGYNLTPVNDESGLPYIISGITLRNNVAFDIGLTGVFIDGDIKQITIENNILFSGITSAGIQIYNTSVTKINELTIRNNFYRDHTASRTDLPTGTNFKTLKQLYGSDNAYNSVFKDATGLLTGTRDFTLVASSPAIGAGYGGVDMGAFAYTQPPINTNLGLVINNIAISKIIFNGLPISVVMRNGVLVFEQGATTPPPEPTFNILISDSFNRADNATTIGKTDTGQVWIVEDGTFGISANKVKLFAGAKSYYSMAVVDPGRSNCTIKLDVTYYTNQSAGIGFRASNKTDFLQFAIDSSGVSLKRYTNYTSTVIGTPYAFTPVNGTTYKLSVKLAGNSIIASLDGVERISVTDSFNATITRHGLRFPNGSNITMDKFEIGEWASN